LLSLDSTPHRVDRKVMRTCPKVPGSWTGSGEERVNIKVCSRTYQSRALIESRSFALGHYVRVKAILWDMTTISMWSSAIINLGKDLVRKSNMTLVD
jgi:hypothetical protein